MRVLFYLQEDKLSPRGGPLGVGYYYHQEMNRRGENCISFLQSNRTYEAVHSTGRKITKHLPKWLNKLHRDIRGVYKLKSFLEKEPPKSKVDFSNYDLVFFHETKDLYIEKENLKLYKGIVVLQSHSPLPLWMEQTADLPKIYFRVIKDLKKKFSRVDEYAFRRADYIIFPCAEAEEAYLEAWPEYRVIHEEKTKVNAFRFIVTGIKGVFAKRTRKEVRDELGIAEDSFVVSYAGRHNTVKGYDLLVEIGSRFLKQNPQDFFVCAGRLGPLKEPAIENWKEIGWTTDPHSYIAASDVFILPNRATYFDLVMLEVMSLGKLILASRTGGNKFFEKNNVGGVILYDSPEDAVEKLVMIKAMSREERIKRGQMNRSYFEKNLTVDAMYDRYKEFVQEVEQ